MRVWLFLLDTFAWNPYLATVGWALVLGGSAALLVRRLSR